MSVFTTLPFPLRPREEAIVSGQIIMLRYKDYECAHRRTAARSSVAQRLVINVTKQSPSCPYYLSTNFSQVMLYQSFDHSPTKRRGRGQVKDAATPRYRR